MPELAEVELVRRQLTAVTGATIARVHTDGSSRFAAAMAAMGGVLGVAERKGKWLSIPVNCLGGGVEGHLGIHLGMTGQLLLVPPASAPSRYRFNFELGDGRTLVLGDVRGFGRVTFTSVPFEGLILGLEPGQTGFTTALRAAAGIGRAPMIMTLLDQHKISGVGAYIAQEALWRAGISPHARSVSDAGIDVLAQKLHDVVTDSINTGGMSMRDYRRLDGSVGESFDRLDCYGRAGQPCRRCGAELHKERIGGRGVTWCRACQA